MTLEGTVTFQSWPAFLATVGILFLAGAYVALTYKKIKRGWRLQDMFYTAVYGALLFGLTTVVFFHFWK